MLEEDLGVVLFNRNTRGVRLTEAGRRFVNQVESAVGILDRAVQTAWMQERGDDGQLRIGVHALIAGCFLEHLLDRFHASHPGIRLHITEGTAREAQFLVRDGRLDVAFMLGADEIPDLNSRVMWRDRLMVAIATNHALASQPGVEWRQLTGETFLVRHGGTGPQIHDLIIARAAGKWQPPTIERVEVERSTLLLMVAAGHGLALFAEENVAANTANVTFLPIRDEPETLPFSAVWSPANRDPALVKLLDMADLLRRQAAR